MSLFEIQRELKAPKGQWNKFGKYNYRSAEDIVEAVKPLLAKHKLSLLTPQHIIEVGGRIYIETDAKIIDESGKVIASATAQAREAESKKGMDESQVSGATGSYSKKNALNNLFAIDDNKDSDDDGSGGGKITPKQVADIEALISEVKADKGKFLKYLKVDSLENLGAQAYNTAISALEAKRK